MIFISEKFSISRINPSSSQLLNKLEDMDWIWADDFYSKTSSPHEVVQSEIISCDALAVEELNRVW